MDDAKNSKKSSKRTFGYFSQAEAEETLKRWRNNRSGLMYYLVVAIMVLIVGGFFWYVIGMAIQSVQEGVGNQITSDKWVTNGTYTAFDLANTFVNSIWTYFLVFLVLGVAFYGYIEAQRKGRPY